MPANPILSLGTLKLLAMELPMRIRNARRQGNQTKANTLLGDFGWVLKELREAMILDLDNRFFVMLESTCTQYGIELEKI